MSIDQFTRDAAYFQTMRDRSMMINAEDLDFQFNNLVDYLNIKIVPMINSFVQKEFIGVNNPALAGACLLNVGDGSIRWESINSNIFPDYSIPLSKFASVSPNCIVWAGNDRRFGYNVASNLNDGILFSRNDSTPIWRKINTGDIADKTLIGGHIGLEAVKIEHLGTGVREALFAAPKMILNTNITDAYVSEDNLQDYSLPEDKIANDLLQGRQNAITLGNYVWLDNSIENRHIADQCLIGGQGLDSVPTNIGSTYVSVQVRYTNYYTDDYNNYTFTSNNIIDESITETLIGPTFGWNFYTRLLAEAQFDTGAVEPRHIKDNSVHLFIFSSKIPKEALDPVIRAKLGV